MTRKVTIILRTINDEYSIIDAEMKQRGYHKINSRHKDIRNYQNNKNRRISFIENENIYETENESIKAIFITAKGHKMPEITNAIKEIYDMDWFMALNDQAFLDELSKKKTYERFMSPIQSWPKPILFIVQFLATLFGSGIGWIIAILILYLAKIVAFLPYIKILAILIVLFSISPIPFLAYSFSIKTMQYTNLKQKNAANISIFSYGITALVLSIFMIIIRTKLSGMEVILLLSAIANIICIPFGAMRISSLINRKEIHFDWDTFLDFFKIGL